MSVVEAESMMDLVAARLVRLSEISITSGLLNANGDWRNEVVLLVRLIERYREGKEMDLSIASNLESFRLLNWDDSTERGLKAISFAEAWNAHRQILMEARLFPPVKTFHDTAEVDQFEGQAADAAVKDEQCTDPSPVLPPSRPVAASPPNHGVHNHISKTPDWPGAMKRKTAAAYLDLAEAAFDRDVSAGRLPASFTLGGSPHWRRIALDSALALLSDD